MLARKRLPSHAQALGLLKRNTKIIVVGLDNSGKSTILNALKPQKVRGVATLCDCHSRVSFALLTAPTSAMQNASEEVVPTVGFSEETFERDNLRFTAFDMSGAGTYRSLWESYYGDVQGIIFVVDCSDKIRMCVAKDELDAMLAHKDMKDAHAPLLVMANKQDLPGALEPAEVSLMLGLPSITSSPWQIQ